MWAFAHGLATRVKQETGRCRLPGLSCLKTQRRDFHDYDGDHRAVFEDTSATHLTRREENFVEWAMDSFHFHLPILGRRIRLFKSGSGSVSLCVPKSPFLTAVIGNAGLAAMFKGAS